MITLDYGSGSPQEAAAELAYLVGSPTDTTAIGTGIEWNDTTEPWQTVNWGTVGYWASLRAASPLADGRRAEFPAHRSPGPVHATSSIGKSATRNTAAGKSTITARGPGGDQHRRRSTTRQPTRIRRGVCQLRHARSDTAGLPPSPIGIDSGDPTGASTTTGPENVLTDGAAIGFVPGFISDHSYMQAPGAESDSFLLNDTVSDPQQHPGLVDALRRLRIPAQQTLGAKASSVQVMATEFNSVYADPGKQSTSLVNGLFIADSHRQPARQRLHRRIRLGPAQRLAHRPETTQRPLYGWREGGDYGLLGDPNTNDPPATGAYVAYPSYFAEQLASKIDADRRRSRLRQQQLRRTRRLRGSWKPTGIWICW